MSNNAIKYVAISDDAEDGAPVMSLRFSDGGTPLLVYLGGCVLDLSYWERDELAQFFATAAFALNPQALKQVEADVKGAKP